MLVRYDRFFLKWQLKFRMRTHGLQTWTLPLLQILLKPGKDPTLPSTSCPISFINVDPKILCKAIARALEKITPSIHPDQTGFIKGRHSASNTCRPVNVIDSSPSTNYKPQLSLWETEFDPVNWTFLLAVLHKSGFGSFFINWIKRFSSSPNACARTNVLSSQNFSLNRGTRRGCPLS